MSSRGGWVLAAKAHQGNPYDGHTLAASVDQHERLTGRPPEHAYVDLGYRGHDDDGECEVVVWKKRRGRTPRRVWRWRRRRAAIEPTIAHLKEERRLNRNRLKGREGDAVNALLSGAAKNVRKLLRALALLWRVLAARFGARRLTWAARLASAQRLFQDRLPYIRGSLVSSSLQTRR